ncbi:hypothetical protein KO528_06310 [Saccharophagus degradans]|uniref:hypothetical protein n=1 Tax=Saccharophagus degradans TaxID=86304 RepID=UPI001C0994A7|nr:hypothetical protein [Saccharophagus degradans]MBU2984953.1 hypothetical protein [Saccharophagus degradans]
MTWPAPMDTLGLQVAIRFAANISFTTNIRFSSRKLIECDSCSKFPRAYILQIRAANQP